MVSDLRVKSRQHLVPAAGLLLLSLALFLQTVGYDFLSNWDDYQYVTNNPDIRGFSAANLAHIFTSSYVGNYAPLHLLSYLFDYQIAGLNPAWFHGVNVAIHTLNGLLFYLLVHRITGRRFWGFVSAALFLLHPVQVESVAWVTERKNLLAMFFSLLSYHCYLSYRRNAGEKRHLAYALALFFLLLALFTKSVAVIMPVVFLLHDYLLEGERERRGLVDKIAFFAAAALASVIAMVTQSVGMGGGRVDFFDGDLWAKTLTMLTVFLKYLQLLFVPTNGSLNSVYILFVKSRVDGEVAAALAAAAVLAGAGVVLLRRQPRLFFGVALFLVGLIPVSQIVPLATLMNDRYLYFPMLGAAWVAGGILSALNDRFPLTKVNAAQALACLLIVPCLWVSYQRCAVWRNAVALWSDVARKYPTLKDQRAALAAAYLYDGQKDKALATYEEIFSLKRDFADPLAEQKAYLEAAKLYMEKGSPAKALPLLTAVTAKYPDEPRCALVLGDYYLQVRNLGEAEKAYRKVLAAKPKACQALAPLGAICLETGRVAEARSFYESCREAGGESAEVEYGLARVEARAQAKDKALEHLGEALRLGYRNTDAVMHDPDLAPLRTLQGFNSLVATYFGK